MRVSHDVEEIAVEQRFAARDAQLHTRDVEIGLHSFDEGLLSEMRAADLFIVNNEFPYTDRGTPTAGKQYTFHIGIDLTSVYKEIVFSATVSDWETAIYENNDDF